jgi:hypothetical protein
MAEALMQHEDILGLGRPPCSEALNSVILEADKEAGDEVIGIPVLVKSGGANAPLTLELSVTYINPVLPGRVYGEGQIIRMGRNIGFLEAQLYDEAGKLLVKATSTVKIGPAMIESAK